QQLHPAQWIQVLQQNLTPLIRSLTKNEELLRAAHLLYLHPSVADAVEEDQILHLSEFIRRLPKDELLWLEDFLRPGPFLTVARQRVERMDAKEVAEFLDMTFAEPPSAVCDHMIKRYSGATSFDMANEWSKIIQPQVAHFSIDQIKTTLTAV